MRSSDHPEAARGSASWPRGLGTPSRRSAGGPRLPTSSRTLIGAKIAVSTDGGGHLFDFQRCQLIGPSGEATDLKVAFAYVRELKMRLQYVSTPEAMMDLLRRHARDRDVIQPLYLES
ncbi:hypothetical protein KM176_01125 [Pseudooceanicola sp. CBS1P-1]|uniref:Uncharacterized protein n=1 Tax=Pseudooceanicola albus TaxID=2692189 RepID=A0A6L7G0I0_9RHOB|nr:MULTISPECIES: hypothetical protein [Pseudooceanicola]MBT9382447.1 hypothetical protein [Pseudooceanicola endophyticus]MXN16988.1 hypothetical protein [Pseudooceanicola albus]